ncbi:hypothetical protein ADUPG1_002296 [Aduncisulcus paluster]|uniref:Uncharacterized protein n=1 Tax=Aduncisulcus paluster TaxID=2918883 RepID=A0ABQ5KJ75_9EUKA|nr:hypothetical protein ADUPG1_002296 [Aduncisulcus paluster]
MEQQAVTRAEGISTQNSDLEQSKVTETPTTTVNSTEKEVPSEDDEQLDDGEKHGPNVTTTVYSDGTVEQRLVEDRESVSGTETVRSRRSGDFPSDISETPVQKLVILADSDSTKPKHSDYVFKLTDTRQDEVLAFCNRVEEILKSHPGITLPPMNQMWGTVFNKV